MPCSFQKWLKLCPSHPFSTFGIIFVKEWFTCDNSVGKWKNKETYIIIKVNHTVTQKLWFLLDPGVDALNNFECQKFWRPWVPYLHSFWRHPGLFWREPARKKAMFTRCTSWRWLKKSIDMPKVALKIEILNSRTDQKEVPLVMMWDVWKFPIQNSVANSCGLPKMSCHKPSKSIQTGFSLRPWSMLSLKVEVAHPHWLKRCLNKFSATKLTYLYHLVPMSCDPNLQMLGLRNFFCIHVNWCCLPPLPLMALFCGSLGRAWKSNSVALPLMSHVLSFEPSVHVHTCGSPHGFWEDNSLIGREIGPSPVFHTSEN